MRNLLRSIVLIAAAVAVATPAAAGELTLSIANGRATLIATDVPIRQILAEWARVGGTKVVNGERVIGPNLTLQLVDRPEREVLDAVLRTAAGYVAAPRSVSESALSIYDRILILPTSQAPAYNPAAVSTPTFTPPPRPVISDDDPVEHPNVPPQGVVGVPPAVGVPSPVAVPPGIGQQPQQQPPATQSTPGMPQSLPRPGMLPPPTPAPQNPYAPNPNVPNPNVPTVPGGRPAGPGGTPLPPGVRPPGGGGQ